jgi:hypothetical protein
MKEQLELLAAKVLKTWEAKQRFMATVDGFKMDAEEELAKLETCELPERVVNEQRAVLADRISTAQISHAIAMGEGNMAMDIYNEMKALIAKN